MRRAATLTLLCLAVPPLWLASLLAARAMHRLYQDIGIEP